MLTGCSFRSLVSVIASLAWRNVTFICQEENCDFIETSSQLEVPFQIYCVPFPNNTEVLHLVMNTIAVGDSTHVVAIGDEDFLVATLERAILQDTLSGCHDRMIHRFEWIVSAQPTSRITEAVGNLTNVLAIYTNVHNPACKTLVDTVLWSAERRRRFNRVATWTDATGLSVSSAFYPNKQFGLNGRHLLIGTNTWDAFVRAEKTENGDIIFTGFCVELTKILAQKLNFTYSMQLPKDGEWGTVNENGTFSGLVGMLQSKVADLTIAPLTYTYGRSQVVDFVVSGLYVDDTVILYKKPDSEEYLMTMHYQPLKTSTWVCFGCAILVATVALWGIRVFSHDTSGVAGLPLGMMSFRVMFGAALCQGSDAGSLPSKMPGRLVLFSWYMVVLVITATYTANLVAFLTVPKLPVAFDSLEELADQEQYKCGTLGGSVWVELFETSRNPTYQNIWKKIVAHNGSDLFTISPNQSYHIAVSNHTKYAYIVDRLTAQRTIKLDPSYVQAKKTFLPMLYSIALQHHSVYTEEVNRIMQELHATGMMVQLEKTFLPQSRSTYSSQEAVTILLLHVQGILYLVAGGTAISFLVLLLEILLDISIKKWRRTVGI